MKCPLANSEGLAAGIKNLGNLGPEELDQTRRALFGAERPRRVCSDSDQSGRVSAAGKGNRRTQNLEHPDPFCIIRTQRSDRSEFERNPGSLVYRARYVAGAD
jgi:hypothetical protein